MPFGDTMKIKIFNSFQKTERKPLHLPSTLAVSIATLTSQHQNAAKEIQSKREQAAAQQAALKLAETRQNLHAVSKALQLRDQDYALQLVHQAKKNLQDYCTLTAPLASLEQVRTEVNALIQHKLTDLEDQVLMDKI